MDSDIRSLVGLTEQQFDLLKAIDLAATNKEPKPKDIEIAYQKITGKPIQKPNMFAQLRELQAGEFVIKTNGFYYVNKNKIKQALLEKKKILDEGISKCEALTKNVDQFFKSDSAQTVLKC